MANFKLVDRDTIYVLPHSVDQWLPEDHLARFVVEIVDELDLSALESSYTGSGSDAYHPQMMTALLFYSYVSGRFSSRKIEAATYKSVAVLYGYYSKAYITEGVDHKVTPYVATGRQKHIQRWDEQGVRLRKTPRLWRPWPDD